MSYCINGIELEKYCIIYEKDSVWARRLAYKLRRHLLDTYGAVLEITDKSVRKTATISVGFTDGMDFKVYEHEYFIAVFGTDMTIAARGAFAYEEAEKLLLTEIFAEGKRELEHGDTFSCDVRDTITDTRHYAYNRQGEYRIMSANICGSYGRKEQDPELIRAYREERLQYFKETVLEYLPDFIGVQEHGSVWRLKPCFINAFLPRIGYREARPQNSPNDNNTPIYYRAEKFSLVDCGWHIYTGANNGNSKSYTWAVFKDKKSGKLVGSFSTHYYWTGDEIGRETRKQNSRELCEGIAEARKKFGCPFIGCGDFNSTVPSPPHDILRENGMVNAYDVAAIGARLGTCHKGPTYEDKIKCIVTENDVNATDNFRAYVIDHVYIYGDGVRVGLLDVPMSETALLTTDHTLVISDFTF